MAVPNPDIKGRTEILGLYLAGKPVAADVDVAVLARGTVGFSGADLANLVNVAAVKAAVDGTPVIGGEQLEYAKDKIMMGAERKSAVLSEESRKVSHAARAYADATRQASERRLEHAGRRQRRPKRGGPMFIPLNHATAQSEDRFTFDMRQDADLKSLRTRPETPGTRSLDVEAGVYRSVVLGETVGPLEHDPRGRASAVSPCMGQPAPRCPAPSCRADR